MTTSAQRQHRADAKRARRRKRLAARPAHHHPGPPGVRMHFARTDEARSRGVVRHNFVIPSALRAALRRTNT